MSRHIDVHDPSALVSDDNEDVERTKGKRRHGEEVCDPDLASVEAKECTPAGRWWSTQSLAAIDPDGRGAYIETQRPELTDNPNRTPVRVLRGDASDQALDLGRDARSPRPPMAALPGPVPPPGCAMPADDSLGLNENQGVPPARPAFCQRRPETPVGFLQVRTARPGVHRELMSECEILEDEITPVGWQDRQPTEEELEQNPHGETSALRVGSGAQSATASARRARQNLVSIARMEYLCPTGHRWRPWIPLNDNGSFRYRFHFRFRPATST